MTTAAVVLASVAALLHVVFFALESLLWGREPVWRLFGVRSADDAKAQEGVFFNQGFYNLFLAVGAAVGAVMVARGDSAVLFVYACAFMVAAGLVLLVRFPSLWRGAVAQAVPPALALAALAIA